MICLVLVFYHFGNLVIHLETCAVQVLGLFGRFSGLSLLAAQHLQGASCFASWPCIAGLYISGSHSLLLWFYIWEEFSTLSSNPKEKVEFVALPSSDDIMSCSDSEQRRLN